MKPFFGFPSGTDLSSSGITERNCSVSLLVFIRNNIPPLITVDIYTFGLYVCSNHLKKMLRSFSYGAFFVPHTHTESMKQYFFAGSKFILKYSLSVDKKFFTFAMFDIALMSGKGKKKYIEASLDANEAEQTRRFRTCGIYQL